MRVRILDENHDFVFGKGAQCYSSTSLAVAYSLKTKILSWFGDCFFDMTSGLDWKNLLGAKGSKKDIDTAVRKIIITEDGVKDLVFFDSEITDRKYSCKARIATIYGDTIEVRV